MNALAKVLVVILIVLSAAFAVSQMIFHARRVNYQELYRKTNTDLQDARRDKEKLILQLEARTRESDGRADALLKLENDFTAAKEKSADTISELRETFSISAIVDSRACMLRGMRRRNWPLKGRRFTGGGSGTEFSSKTSMAAGSTVSSSLIASAAVAPKAEMPSSSGTVAMNPSSSSLHATYREYGFMFPHPLDRIPRSSRGGPEPDRTWPCHGRSAG